MSRLNEVISKAKKCLGVDDEPKKVKKCSSKMQKAITAASDRLSEYETLEKGAMDAMYHHALHARAAQAASYGEPNKPFDAESAKGKREKAKKHEFMMLRHALEEARKKCSDWNGSMASKMRKYTDFMDGESYDMEKDPEFAKAKAHYMKGGEFKGHKEDKFKEDY